VGIDTPPTGGVWPVFYDDEPSSPDNCLTVAGTSNLLQIRTQFDGEWEEPAGVQVRVRGKTSDIAGVKAQEVAWKMDKTPPRTVVTIESHTYLIHTINRTGGVINVGKESANSDRWLYSVNALISIDQLT